MINFDYVVYWGAPVDHNPSFLRIGWVQKYNFYIFRKGLLKEEFTWVLQNFYDIQSRNIYKKNGLGSSKRPSVNRGLKERILIPPKGERSTAFFAFNTKYIYINKHGIEV